MEPNQLKGGGNAKDFIINMGAIVALYTIVFTLVDLLFIIINKAYPQINGYYSYFSSQSISWPVAVLIIFFPIFILLMWLLEKDYKTNPEKQNSGVHRWLTYITLFFAGLTIAIDLITVLYYFIDGQELTTGFLLKVLVLLVVVGSIFMYYISDLRNKLTAKSRIYWRLFAGAVILASIVWGFSVLGSPRTQQLLKYDETRISDMQYLDSMIRTYYSNSGHLPKSIAELDDFSAPIDPQTKEEYEYVYKTKTTYDLCAVFNKSTSDAITTNARVVGLIGNDSWNHDAGHYCFSETINPSNYPSYPKY